MSALSYQQCYEILGLQNHADLAEAESSYRKLVHQWHPDRYQGEDPSEATRRYVEITKAFKKLRDFHKDNKTLPFSSVDDVATNETSSAAEEQKQESKKQQNSNQAKSNVDAIDPAAKRRITNAKWNNKEQFRPSRFVLTIGTVFVVGVSLILLFMTKLDRINSDRFRDEARLERISERLVEQQDDHQ